MYFNASPTNITELLVVCLAVVSIIMLLKKRYDSNHSAPVLFAGGDVHQRRDRPVHPAILYGGLVFCLLLRFEFMGKKISKMVAFFANVGLVLMIWSMMSDVLA